MFWKKKQKYPQGVIEEAKDHPNGFVYEYDKRFGVGGRVPSYAIQGAWAVDEYGNVKGDFSPNSNYREDKVKRLFEQAQKPPNDKLLDVDYRLYGFPRIPSFAIHGYWPVDENGEISERYHPNTKYDKGKLIQFIRQSSN